MNTIKFNDIRNLDFHRLSGSGYIMNEDYSDLIHQYGSFVTKPFFLLSPTFNSITGEKRYRFVIVEINGNCFLLPYKVVNILNIRQIRIFCDYGIFKGNREFRKILSALLKLDFVKIIMYGGVYCTERKPKKLVEYNDYYFDYSEKCDYYKSSRFRSSSYINKIESNKNFQVSYSSSENADDMMMVRDAWRLGEERRGIKINSKLDFYTNKFFYSQKDNIRFISIRYKGNIISLQVFLLTKEHSYAECIFILHIWDFGDDDDLRKALGSITDIQRYYAWKYLNQQDGIERLYMAGCSKGNNRLLKHKERICDGKIEYFII